MKGEKKFLGFFLIFALAASAQAFKLGFASETAAARALSPSAVYAKDAPAVVLFMCGGSGEKGSLGTGSVIDKRGYVLTNAHVIFPEGATEPYPEIRIYFKPEHLETYPQLHEIFWKATKTAGEAKKTNDVAVADDLLAQIAEIDRIFWETKK